ncbi:MAG TPA: hypothetical protein VJ738_05415 [Steroidobacteraceae bacterium]|nr:hypothetical protein [Steroidobacteraceae bacterium]
MAERSRCGGSASRRALAVALAAGTVLLLGPAIASAADSNVQPAGAPPSQWAQYQAQAPKSILELQPFRTLAQVELEGAGLAPGSATLVDLNPTVNVWFLLTLDPPASATSRTFHLENPRPLEQRPRLIVEGGRALRIGGLAGDEPCELWSAAGDELDEAAHSRLPSASLCGGRLYLRNAVTGHHTSLERITDFLRDHVYGGEEIISFVKEQMYRDAFLERGVERAATDCRPAGSTDLPLAATVSAESAARCLMPGSLGLDVMRTTAGFTPGSWYRVRDLPGVYVSALTPADMTASLLAAESHVNRLDAVESGALVYVVAFDLSELDLHFALGTDHPRLGWSPRPPERAYDARLPGPDGVATPAPLVMNGLVGPADIGRTIATFTGGFKREHGAFRYGPLALVNHGSHYGFIQEGVILSKLEPGLATLLVMSDGRTEMKTWTRSDDASLASIRYARQNGVPLIEFDPAIGRGVPGALVNLWGPGNWSGSAAEALRTLRAGACLQESGSRPFLLYGYFSAATPSAMARVFQAYQCRYAMQLDINALEHTYLALYVHRNRERLVEHLVQGMEQCDSRTREGFAPRFLAAPDDRDFFYLTRRDPSP